jgi:hypothetical protein
MRRAAAVICVVWLAACAGQKKQDVRVAQGVVRPEVEPFRDTLDLHRMYCSLACGRAGNAEARRRSHPPVCTDAVAIGAQIAPIETVETVETVDAGTIQGIVTPALAGPKGKAVVANMVARAGTQSTALTANGTFSMTLPAGRYTMAVGLMDEQAYFCVEVRPGETTHVSARFTGRPIDRPCRCSFDLGDYWWFDGL